MIDFIFWLIFVDVIGLITFPITFTFFNKSADRGYSVAKVLGLLIWGYVYWIGNSFGLLNNSRGGAFTALFMLLLVAIAILRRARAGKVFQWLKENISLVMFHEIIFMAAFLIWAVIRGANPEISGTEKPMELAFINAIYQSPTFPPSDPWLSGYSISYYYFGYMLVAAFMKLIGTASGTAFNLAIALTFGLVSSTSSGFLFNLLKNKGIPSENQVSSRRNRQILFLSLLAPLFILIISNAEGFLEMLHSRGVFWNFSTDNQVTSKFWSWLDIQDLTAAPSLPLDWVPSRMGGSWWWRASRVLQDYQIGGQTREIIDEFPFFSFLLADLHPHVIAMPYVLLGVFSGFYVFNNPLDEKTKSAGWMKYLLLPQVWFLAFTAGSLIFINTWDFPIYFGLISLAFIIPYIQKHGWTKGSLKEFLLFVIPFGISSIMIYLPFLLGLSTQAGGIQPSLIYRTRFVHYLVMFFPQVCILTIYLGYKLVKRKPDKRFSRILITGIIVAIFLFSITLLFPVFSEIGLSLLTNISSLMGIDTSALSQRILQANQSFYGVYGAVNNGEIITESIRRFMDYPILVVFLTVGISVILFLLFSNESRKDDSQPQFENNRTDQYIYILVLLGLLLTLFPEFFYLRDQFGWRMNTIFKFYFQAWILFSIASAYAVSNIRFNKKKNLRMVLAAGSIMVMLIGLAYSAFSIINKTNSFRNIEWSLDGNLFFERFHPEENEAISYLTSLPYGTVAEAIGGSYSGYARVSRLSGYPTVLGWPGHELQWRGGGEEIGSREGDIRQLYELNDWESTREILDRYQISYVFVGSNERTQYSVREGKFMGNLALIYNNNDVCIYAYTQVK